MIEKKSIMIVDDYAILRQGFTKIIDMESNSKIIGEAPNGREAVSLVEKLMPDMIITDIKMHS